MLKRSAMLELKYWKILHWNSMRVFSQSGNTNVHITYKYFTKCYQILLFLCQRNIGIIETSYDITSIDKKY
jgi:hypothetical protein